MSRPVVDGQREWTCSRVAGQFRRPHWSSPAPWWRSQQWSSFTSAKLTSPWCRYGTPLLSVDLIFVVWCESVARPWRELRDR